MKKDLIAVIVGIVILISAVTVVTAVASSKAIKSFLSGIGSSDGKVREIDNDTADALALSYLQEKYGEEFVVVSRINPWEFGRGTHEL